MRDSSILYFYFRERLYFTYHVQMPVSTPYCVCLFFTHSAHRHQSAAAKQQASEIAAVRETLAAQNTAVQGLVASWAKTHAASGTPLDAFCYIFPNHRTTHSKLRPNIVGIFNVLRGM
jgi:hypothetical protein